jgi:rfaE bifunctional protein kinase chain/domain
MPAFLTDAVLEGILQRIPSLRIGVIGDLFLDRYLDIAAELTEPSLETGHDAYQVVQVRSVPGAAGTVVNNLVALGVGGVIPVAVIGDDGEGYELVQALDRLGRVDRTAVIQTPQRRTPTYTKPMLLERGAVPRELNRLDIKNRQVLPKALESAILERLDQVWEHVNSLVVLDQVSEEDCGVVTDAVRRRLGEKALADRSKFVLADSRERIGLFRTVCVKPNLRECRRAVAAVEAADPGTVARELAQRTGRSVFCTAGEKGIFVAAEAGATLAMQVPAYPVAGPIDVVGAGDSTSAAIVCAAAGGADATEAAAFGNLVASITIQQLGTTGTASPDMVRLRWKEVRHPQLPPWGR